MRTACAPPSLRPDALLHITSPSSYLFLPLLHFFTSYLSLHGLSLISFSFTLPSPCPPHPPYTLSSVLPFHIFPPPIALTPPPSSTLPLGFSPYIQKPHGGSASNLHMLGSPFVLLVQGPHNAVSSARDPLCADLIR